MTVVSDVNEKLKEENEKLQIQFLEQKQQLEELNDRFQVYSRVSVTTVAPLSAC